MMSDRDDVIARAESAAENLPEGISARSMQDLPIALVIADAQLEDTPLIYVNGAFEKITGYARQAVVGRNCRFLQGEDTSPEDRDAIRKAIEAGEEITLDIVNYRANGEKFMNRLMIVPLRDESETVTHFLGVQTIAPEGGSAAARALRLDESLREVQHRVKNHLAMLLALIRMEARQARDPTTALDVLANRVEALNLLYDEFARSSPGNSDTIALGAYVSRVCSALNMLDGKSEVRMNLMTEKLDASVDSASQIGLLTSELLTNALQHGFDEKARGIVEVRLEEDDYGYVSLSVEDDGTGMPSGTEWPQEGNLGARIVRDLAGRLQAEIDVSSDEDGTTIVIKVPKKSLAPKT